MAIVDILMKRDGIGRREAKSIVAECKRRLEEEAIPFGDYELAEDILAEELGLEMDYIFELV